MPLDGLPPGFADCKRDPSCSRGPSPLRHDDDPKPRMTNFKKSIRKGPCAPHDGFGTREWEDRWPRARERAAGKCKSFKKRTAPKHINDLPPTSTSPWSRQKRKHNLINQVQAFAGPGQARESKRATTLLEQGGERCGTYKVRHTKILSQSVWFR